MDADQNVALQTVQMDSMWKAMTIWVAANVFQTFNGILKTNAVPVDDMSLIAYNCLPCSTTLNCYVNPHPSYQSVF